MNNVSQSTLSIKSIKIYLSKLLVILLVLQFFTFQQSQTATATGTPTVTAPASIIASAANTDYSVTGLSVGGVTGTYLVVLKLKNGRTNSYLKMTTTTGLTESFGFGGSNSNKFSGFTEMSFTGTETHVNAGLATLKLYSGEGGGTPSIEITASEFVSGVTYSADTGHYYKAVTASVNFATASAAATSSTFQGQNGYLVTITSAAEDNYVLNKVDVNNIWIGATDSASEGAWRWETGTAVTSPEKGKQFWTGASAGDNYTNDGLNYANWCDGEPNDSSSNEDYAVTKWSGGSCWNDLSGTTLAGGYVIEYGSDGGATFTGSATATIAIENTLPGTPETPTATAGNGAATITIAAPLTGGVVDSYTVTANPGGATCTVNSPITSCTISGLTNGTLYTFTSIAYNSAGSSSSSPESTPATQPVGPPGKPSAIPGDSSAIVTVTAPTGTSPTSFTVTSNPGSQTCTVTSPSDTCTVTGLTNGTSYTFTVTALVNGANTVSSAASDPVKPIASTSNSAAPVLSGISAVGETLTVTSGTWTNINSYVTYSYQWANSPDGSNWNDISGATSPNYVLRSSDLNLYLRASVTPIVAVAVTAANSNPTILFVKEKGYSASDFTIAANASQVNREITLTQSSGNQKGAVFSNSRINLQNNFSISGEIYLGSSDSGADGLAFVMQPNSTTTLSSGGGLGYDGVTNAFAIEFDTYFNSGAANGDIANDHAALMKSQATVHDAWNASVIDLGNIEDNKYRKLEIVWISSANAASACTGTEGKLTVKYDINANGVFDAGDTIYNDFCIDLESYFSASNFNTYFGFTAATGGSVNLQKVQNIAYSATSRSNTAPVISSISNVSVQKNSGQQSIVVPVNEDNTSAGQWTISITSSNTSAVPAVSVLSPYPTISSGSGNFTLRFTPSVTETGTATITFNLVDADGATASKTFNVIVTDYPTLSITTPTTGITGTRGSSYSLAISASGGSSETYTFTTSSSLPPGISLDANSGVLSGTPTASGDYAIVITVTDSASNSVSTSSFVISISSPPSGGGGGGYVDPTPATPPAAPTPTITTPNLPPATGGAPFNFQIGATNGSNFAVSGGSLPQGLTLNPTTGTITGTPTEPGPYSFSVTVTNTTGQKTTVTFTGNIESATGNTNSGSGSSAESNSGSNSGAGSANGSENGNGSNSSSGSNSGAGNPNVIAPITPPANLATAPVGGNLLVLVDGAAVNATIKPNAASNGYEVVAPGWNLNLQPLNSAGQPLPLNSNSQIVLDSTRLVGINGEGFAPNSIVHVYLFSTPKLLGTTNTDANGKFNASFPVPTSVDPGNHVIQVNGLSPKKEVRSASVGLLVEAVKKDSASLKDLNFNLQKVGSKGLITFSKGKAAVAGAQTKIIKSYKFKRGATIEVVGYASKSAGQDDLRISLDRALNVKKALQRLHPDLKISAIGGGVKRNALCAKYANQCAVITIKK